MNYRHTAKQKLTTIVGVLMLCAALVPAMVGAEGRQANGVGQGNTNMANIVAVGGSATATCTASGSPTATGGVLGIALNLNVCVPVAIGGPAIVVNTAPITQTATNTATASNTNTQ
jgi:hypothetical protein